MSTTKQIVTNPVHAALIFILDHLSATATGPNGTEHLTAARLKADLMNECYPEPDIAVREVKTTERQPLASNTSPQGQSANIPVKA